VKEYQYFWKKTQRMKNEEGKMKRKDQEIYHQGAQRNTKGKTGRRKTRNFTTTAHEGTQKGRCVFPRRALAKLKLGRNSWSFAKWPAGRPAVLMPGFLQSKNPQPKNGTEAIFGQRNGIGAVSFFAVGKKDTSG
jgi:hypothetical protein